MMIDDDVIVRLINMPHTVKGIVSKSPDGIYNIYVNARQSRELQKKALKHETDHIEKGDLESDESIVKIEIAPFGS